MPRKPGITDEMIIEMYKNGMTFKEMAAAVGLTDRAIRNVLYKHDVEITRSGPPRKNKVNEDFFKIWSHEMAWVLGLFITDGHVTKGNYSTIGLTQKDESILRLVAKYMDADYIVTKTDTRRAQQFLIYSAEIRKDLAKIGVFPDKSRTVPFPKAPKEYLPALVRGIIDGDGWVQDRGYVMNVTSGSIAFAEGLKQVFESWNLKTEISSETTKAGNLIYRIWVKGKDDIAKLSEIIYEDSLEDFVTHKRERMSQRSFGQMKLF